MRSRGDQFSHCVSKCRVRANIEDWERVLPIIHAARRKYDGDEVDAGVIEERGRTCFREQLPLSVQMPSNKRISMSSLPLHRPSRCCPRHCCYYQPPLVTSQLRGPKVAARLGGVDRHYQRSIESHPSCDKIHLLDRHNISLRPDPQIPNCLWV